MIGTQRLMHVKETRQYEHNNKMCSVLKFTVFVTYFLLYWQYCSGIIGREAVVSRLLKDVKL